MEELLALRPVWAALKDPLLIGAATAAAFTLNALRKDVGRLFARTRATEERVNAQETRIAVLEDRSGLPVASPAAPRR